MATKKHNATIASAHERLGEMGQTVAKDVAKTAGNEIKETGKSFIEQLLGLDLGSQSETTAHKTPTEATQQTNPGEIFNASMLKHSAEAKHNKPVHADKPKEKKHANVEAAMNYSRDIAQTSERASKVEVREMHQTVREIQEELRQLVNSSAVLKMEFGEFVVEQAPAEVGKYHMRFFEWVLITIRQARAKVEDSGAWLNTVKGKNSKKGYWGMFKKHGTSFGLSSERSTATQTG